MAQRYFSLPLGGQKKDVTNASTSTSADAVELRVDEAQIASPQGLNQLRISLDEIWAALNEFQRYG